MSGVASDHHALHCSGVTDLGVSSRSIHISKMVIVRHRCLISTICYLRISPWLWFKAATVTDPDRYILVLAGGDGRHSCWLLP